MRFDTDLICPETGKLYFKLQIGLTLFYTEVWFPCEGPVFDHCINTAYHSQSVFFSINRLLQLRDSLVNLLRCIALKERRNCHLVVEFLRIPKEKHYVEDKDKVR